MDEQIIELQEKVVELENNWKRALADYSNLQKRFAEERQSIVKFANSTLILRLLSVLDNLEMLQLHSEDEGLKLVVKDFSQTLQEEGVTEIKVEGAFFDSTLMDAIEMVEGEEGKVTEVCSKGYILKDKVLRPARVKVGKGVKKDAVQKEEQTNG